MDQATADVCKVRRDQNDRTFPLLAALSFTDIVEDNELEKNLNGLRKSIEDELLPRLYESSYIEKSRLELALDRVLKGCSHAVQSS